MAGVGKDSMRGLLLALGPGVVRPVLRRQCKAGGEDYVPVSLVLRMGKAGS